MIVILCFPSDIRMSLQVVGLHLGILIKVQITVLNFNFISLLQHSDINVEVQLILTKIYYPEKRTIIKQSIKRATHLGSVANYNLVRCHCWSDVTKEQ